MLAAILALAAWAATVPVTPTSPQSPRQTVRIEANQHAKDTAQSKGYGGEQERASEEVPIRATRDDGTANSNGGDAEGERRAEERSEYWHIFGHRIKITDALLSIFTALLFVSTTGLWLETFFMRNDAAKGLSASRRAYVFVLEMVPVWERIASGEVLYAFRPRWVNSGETQTKGMINYIAAEFRDDVLPANFDFSDASATPFPNAIGPKSNTQGGRTRAFSESEMREIVDGRKFLYIWGWARYNDIYPKTPQHLSRYCVEVKVYGDPSNPEGMPTKFNILFMVHPTGNCSDDECVAQGLA